MKTVLIALSHFHGDHYFGLPGLLQSMNALDRQEPLYIAGPEGLERELEPILKLAGELKYEVKLISLLHGRQLKLHELCPAFPHAASLRAFKTAHRVESLGYAFSLPRAGVFLPEKARALALPQKDWGRIQRGETVEFQGRSITPEMVLGPPRRGIKIVFSGDTAACDELTLAAAEADLMICDATYAEDEQAERAAEYGHMTFTQAACTARLAGVRRLWLSHYSPMIKSPEDYIQNAREIFPTAECGYDGMHIRLSFE